MQILFFFTFLLFFLFLFSVFLTQLENCICCILLKKGPFTLNIINILIFNCQKTRSVDSRNKKLSWVFKDVQRYDVTAK